MGTKIEIVEGTRVEVIAVGVSHWRGQPVAVGTLGTITDVDLDSIYVSLDTDKLGFEIGEGDDALDYADPLEISTFVFNDYFRSI